VQRGEAVMSLELVMWRLETPFAVGAVMCDEWGNLLPWASAPIFRKWIHGGQTIGELQRFVADRKGWFLTNEEEESITALASHDEDDSEPVVWPT